MKHFFYLVAFSLLSKGIIGQQAFNCSSHHKFQKLMENDPTFRNNQLQLEEETQKFSEQINQLKSTTSAAYIIAVVFHVIYTTQAGNISSAQIIDQIDILNKEFNRLQADTALTPAAFKSAAAPFSVEFRLATIDPNGNCTNGINRLYSSLSNCSFEENDVKALSYWPSNKYLNIWIVQSMHYSGSMDCNGGGYATFPGGLATLDGINIRGDLISNIGTAASNSSWGNFKGRYLIHELGHWFNLRHIWGDATCGNDQVSDTPTAQNSNSGCPNFPHNPFSSCSGSNANGEMFTNYMDYTNGPCLNMFTAGQVTRMTACINSPVSGRSNLWSNTNLNATGTNDPYTYPVACPSNPALLPYGTLVVCKGDSVKFTDNSYGGNSGTRSWSFPGGSASSLTDSIVKVQYTTPGFYSVSLSKTYQSTTKTEQFVDKVHVLDDAPNLNYVFPFSEDFENPSFFAFDWTVINTDQDQTAWEWLNSTSYSGDYCVGVMNFGKQAPLVEELISPAYDLTSVQSPTLSFRLHFANRITANYDKLVVYISKNCGDSWQQIYSSSASSNLSTVAGNIGNSNIPQVGSDDDWRLEKVNIFNSYAGATVRFKFVFTSGGGNNLFIDDINIDGISTVGITKNAVMKNGIKVLPNPAKENIQIKFEQKNNAPAQIEIRDVLGKVILIKERVTSNETINIAELKDGVYFIQVKQNGRISHSTKFIKQAYN